MSWIDSFPALSGLDPETRREAEAGARTIKVPKGTVIFGPGKPADNLLLVDGGTVRVQQVSEGGREIVLYRVAAGESCVLTTACLLAQDNYAAEGIAETDVSAIAIPRAVFDSIIARSPEFRRFVFSAYSERITDLFLTIEDIAFQRMDIRLAARLVRLADARDTVNATHQQLAAELGSAREVISRLLQEFQRRDWVSQSRGTIVLRDRAALEALAETAA